MEIELYIVPKDEEGIKIKNFLLKNNLSFHEMITDNIELLSQIAHSKLLTKISLLKIRFSHSIHIIKGYQEHSLNQLLEHINKYNLRLI